VSNPYGYADDSSDDDNISEMTSQDDWDVISFSTSYSDISAVSKDVGCPDSQVELASLFNNDHNVLPLLVASQPPDLQAFGGRYTMAIKRASLKQPFGLSFHGTEGSDRQLSKISIAQDFPQFGIQRFDELVFVNQRRPKSIQECRSILQEALSLTLVLERRPHETEIETIACPDPCGKTGCAAACSNKPSEAMRHVLAITKPTVLDHDRLEFEVVVQRCSLAQKLGISFHTNCKKDKDKEREIEIASSMAKGGRRQPVYPFCGGIRGKHSLETSEASQKQKKKDNTLDIKVGTSLPHMGLKRGDKLVSINGVVPKSKMKCLRIYQSSLVVKMVFRRKSARKLAKLKAKVQAMDQEQQGDCSLFRSCF